MRLRRDRGGVVITAGFVVSWGRESLTKTMVNRRILATGFLAFAVQLALRVGGHVLAIPRNAIVSLHMLVWGTAGATMGSHERLEWRAGLSLPARVVAAPRGLPARRHAHARRAPRP